MKFLILATIIGFVAVASVPSAKSLSSDAEAPIVKSSSDVGAEGFNYAYETGNDIAANAEGELKQFADAAAVVVKGAFRYVAPDGTPVVFSYVADENGYQPQSDILPQAPPVPEAIQRSLEYIAAHPSKQNYETGNDIAANAEGELKQFAEAAAVVVKGAFRYVAPDGTPVVFTYVADENGYQPQSDLLPQAPPVPEAIQRALEYIAAHPSKQK